MNDEQLEVVEADETEAELGVEVLNRLFVAPQWELLIWAVALSSLQVVYFDFLSLDWVICDLYELCLDSDVERILIVAFLAFASCTDLRYAEASDVFQEYFALISEASF